MFAQDNIKISVFENIVKLQSAAVQWGFSDAASAINLVNPAESFPPSTSFIHTIGFVKKNKNITTSMMTEVSAMIRFQMVSCARCKSGFLAAAPGLRVRAWLVYKS